MKKQYFKYKLSDLLLNEGFYADALSDDESDGFEDEDDSESVYKLDNLLDSKNFMGDDQIDNSEFKQINFIILTVMTVIDSIKDNVTLISNFINTNKIDSENEKKSINLDFSKFNSKLKSIVESGTKGGKKEEYYKKVYEIIKNFIPKSVCIKYLLSIIDENKEILEVLNSNGSQLNNNSSNIQNVINTTRDSIIKEMNKVKLSDEQLIQFVSANSQKRGLEKGRIGSQDDPTLGFLGDLKQLFHMLLGSESTLFLKELFNSISDVYKQVGSLDNLSKEEKQEEIKNQFVPILEFESDFARGKVTPQNLETKVTTVKQKIKELTLDEKFEKFKDKNPKKLEFKTNTFNNEKPKIKYEFGKSKNK
jgi:hypothetical protein